MIQSYLVSLSQWAVLQNRKLKMARLVQLPTKYTPEEWHRSNHMNYSNAERERKSAEMIRDESNRLKHEIHVTTIKTQSDVNKKLDQRIQDITFWKSELDRLHGETEDEINELLRYKDRLEKALDATQLPLNVAKQCLGNREERTQIDLVHDDVEIQLIKVTAHIIFTPYHYYIVTIVLLP